MSRKEGNSWPGRARLPPPPRPAMTQQGEICSPLVERPTQVHLGLGRASTSRPIRKFRTVPKLPCVQTGLSSRVHLTLFPYQAKCVATSMASSALAVVLALRTVRRDRAPKMPRTKFKDRGVRGLLLPRRLQVADMHSHKYDCPTSTGTKRASGLYFTRQFLLDRFSPVNEK